MIQSGEDLTRFNEGLTLQAKPDTHGRFELGYGCNFWNGLPVAEGQCCTEDEADQQFSVLYPQAELRAFNDLGASGWATLSTQRRAVLTDMAYEMGGDGLKVFVTFLGYIRIGNWQMGAEDLRQTKLFSQVPERENRNIAILLTGEWPQEGT